LNSHTKYTIIYDQKFPTNTPDIIEVTLCRVYTCSLLTSHDVLYIDDLITKENCTQLESGPRITPLQVVTATHITLTHTSKAAISNAQV